MKRTPTVDYSNSEIEHLIDEYIHSTADRKLLKLRFIEGATYEQIAEALDIHETTCRRRVYRLQNELFKHL